MEQTMQLNRPENLDDELYRCLFSGLTSGIDLDDLIFNGEEWYESER